MAIIYSNKIKTNTFIDTIIYADVDAGCIYDMTALVQMEGVIDTLVRIKSPVPEKVIKNLINF